MAAANTISDGTTVVFGTSGFEAFVDSLRWSGQGREAIDMSHLATTAGITYKPSKMYDPGTLQMDIHHDPDQNVATTLVADEESITITFPLRSGSTPATFVATGFITNYEFSSEKRDKVSGSVTVKLSGTPVITAEV